jgi:hypothetical protein
MRFFWLLSGNLGEMQPCCQYRPAKPIISRALWMAFFGRASGPPAKSLICQPFATAHSCHPSKQVLRFWNNLAVNPGHLIGGSSGGRPAERPRISDRRRKHSRILWDNKKLRA